MSALPILLGIALFQSQDPPGSHASTFDFALALKLPSGKANTKLIQVREKLLQALRNGLNEFDAIAKPQYVQALKSPVNHRFTEEEILYLGMYRRVHFRPNYGLQSDHLLERVIKSSLSPDITVLSVLPYLIDHIFKSRPDIIRALVERFPDDRQLLETSLYLRGLFFDSLALPERRRELLKEIRVFEAKNSATIYTRIGGLMQELKLSVDQHDPDAFKVAESKYFLLMRGSELTDWEYMMLWGGHIHGRHILFGEPNGKLTGWDWGKKRYTNGRPKP